MTVRVFFGSVLAAVYNVVLSGLPTRTLRQAYLRLWLAQWGASSGIQMDCRILNGRKIHIGNRVVINFGCLLDGRRYPIHIGNDVSIGPEAAILTLGHDPQSIDFSLRGGAVQIGDRAWIGYRAIVLPGVSVGEGAVVAAGSVVTRDVPAFTVVAGSPARVISERRRDLAYTLSYRPWLM
jgi:acetyltransferase-like isoleucine patch superfamily enzyme